MKKTLICLSLLLVLALSLSACGSIKPEDYLTLGNYKGIEVTFLTDYTVTDADVEAAIQEQLTSDATETREVTRAIKMGDTVNADYIGKLDGVAFDKGSAEGAEIKVVENSGYIEGFVESLVGHKTGETFDAKVTFPDPYANNPDLAGKETVFTFTINSVTEPVLPELTDEYVSGAYGYDTVAAWKDALKESLSADKKSNAESQRDNDLWQAVTESTTYKELPKSELDAYIKEQMDDVESYAKQYGTDVETLLAQQSYTVESYKEMLQPYAESYVKQKLTMQAIANAEGLNVTDAEYISEATAMAAEYDCSTLTEFEGQYTKETIRQQIMWNRVMDFIRDNAKYTEPTA